MNHLRVYIIEKGILFSFNYNASAGGKKNRENPVIVQRRHAARIAEITYV